MEKLTQMKDELSAVSYDVYKMTASELKDRLIRDAQVPEEEIIRFDSTSEYQKRQYDIDIYSKRKKGERVRYATLGFESAPFIVSLNSVTGKMKLMDGFNRLFGTYESFDNEVLVKVYTDVSARVWMNVMSFANAWKVKNARHSADFMDRGFKWSLYEHFEVDLAISPMGNFDNQLSLGFMDAYTSGSRYNYQSDTALDTLINNQECIHDIDVMKKMVLTPISFRETKRKVVTEVKVNERSHASRGQSLDIVQEKIMVMLGRIRRAEMASEKPQQRLSYDAIREFLERDDLQKAFVKVSNMQVYGHAENFVKRELEESIKEHLMTALGHTYTPPAPVIKREPITDWSDMKF